MYLEYYGLKQAPFDITPNPRFLFHSAKHREAFNHLLYGIRERKGFVQLTGEVGAGKTTLCRALLEQLDAHFSTALILNPVLNADELMKAIATEFGLNVKGLDRLETIAAISEFLSSRLEHGKETVLIIDEAQNLTEDLLEQVRLLSNIETDDRKLLQIVLMGQPELRDRLNSPRLQQLRQRITVRYHLAPLTRVEVAQYIQHRLDVCRRERRAVFHAAGGLARFQLQRRHSAAGQRGLRQGAAGRFCPAQRPHQLSRWWAAPSANWKGTFTHEPDQRRAETRKRHRSKKTRRPACRRCCRSNPSERSAVADWILARRDHPAAPVVAVFFIGLSAAHHTVKNIVTTPDRCRHPAG